MLMNLCRLRLMVICDCRTFLGWLLMSITTTDYYQLLVISTHLPDDLTITIRSSSNLIPLDSILPLMVLLTSLLRHRRLSMMVLLKLLVYRLSRCFFRREMLHRPNIPLLKCAI